MKIDPVFPSPPPVDPPRYKFKPVASRPSLPVEEVVEDEEEVDPEEAWPRDTKLLMLLVTILSLVVLFS